MELIPCMWENRNAFRFCIGNHEEKRPLTKFRCRWENNMRMYLKLDGMALTEFMGLRTGKGGGPM
jgi:hypothetical protein